MEITNNKGICILIQICIDLEKNMLFIDINKGKVATYYSLKGFTAALISTCIIARINHMWFNSSLLYCPHLNLQLYIFCLSSTLNLTRN